MDKTILIDRILRGGIYYVKLPSDHKLRPYVVISKDNGYAKSVLALSITSKCVDAAVHLPIVLSGTISFIRTSAPIEISSKDIIAADFGGVIPPRILDMAIEMFVSRITDKEENKMIKMEYLDVLESAGYTLHDNREPFSASTFLGIGDNLKKKSKLLEFKLPYSLQEWDDKALKEFKHDMYRMNMNALKEKYNSSESRINFLKQNVGKELKRRKKVG